MATPWEQAQVFVESHWMRFKSQSRRAVPTRPLDALDSIARGWVGAELLDRLNVPAWVFMYLPSGNGLYEWAGNVGDTDLGRGVLGFAKLLTMKSSGGMLFLGAWKHGQLDIPAVVFVRRSGLFIFDKLDIKYRLLTEQQWEQYAIV